MNPQEPQEFSLQSQQEHFSHNPLPLPRKRWQFWRRKPESLSETPYVLPHPPVGERDTPSAPHSLSLANAATAADLVPEVQNTSLPMRDGKPLRPWEMRMADHLRQPRWAYILVLFLVVAALVAITISTAMLMTHGPNNAGSQHASSPIGNAQATSTPIGVFSEETPTGQGHTPTSQGATPGTAPTGVLPSGAVPSPSPIVVPTATSVPPQPTATPTPRPACMAPSSWPSTKSWINIFTTAIGRSGTSNSCAQVGQSYTSTNPQYVWCRRWGGEVSDSSGNYNHWWLWTDLDTGSRGWISAYYIQGQGNDQANDKNTGKPIPDC